MSRLQERSLPLIGFNVEIAGVLEANAVTFDFAVFSNRELASVVMVSADPLLRVLGFTDVCCWSIRAWTPINGTFRSLFGGPGGFLVVAQAVQVLMLARGSFESRL